MQLGLLWYDNDPKSSLDEKIGRAVKYYRDKYAKCPLICWVNPNTPVTEYTGEIEIKTSRSILPNHFWIGVKE